MELFSFLSTKAEELFSFNLLPPRSKEEVKQEVKRKKAFLYSFTAPGAVLSFALIVLLLNVLAIEPTRASWQSGVDVLQTELNNPTNSLGQLKVTNGELKLKTDFISDPVQKNVNFEEVFRITELVFSGNSSLSRPTSYGREETGRFLVNAVTRRSTGPAEILDKFKLQEDVSDPQLLLVSLPSADGEYGFTVSFALKTIASTGQQTVVQ